MKISRIQSCCEPPKRVNARPIRQNNMNFVALGNKLDVTTSNIKVQETLGKNVNFIA